MVLNYDKRRFVFMRTWLPLLFLLPFCAAGQGSLPAASVAPVFRNLETPAVPLVAEAENRMDAAFRSEGKAFFLRITGTGAAAHTINTGESLIFLLQNDSTVTVKSTAVQGYDDLDTKRSYQHVYAVLPPDLEMLQRSPVQALRKYSVIGYDDFLLDATAAANFQSLTARFLQMLDREGLLKKVTLTEPSFPGGREVMLHFLHKNLKQLPVLPGRKPITARVQFRVDEEGRLKGLQVQQSAGAVYDAELLRILKRMPLWKPALADGRPVQRDVTLQVVFYQATGKISVSWQ